MSSDLLTGLLRASSDGLAIVRLSDETLLHVSESFLTLTGFSWEDIAGRKASELGLWPLDPDGSAAGFLQELGERGSVTGIMAGLQTKADDVRTVELAAHVTSMEGEQCVLTIHRDFTDRRLIEERLRQAEAKYRALVEQIPAVLYVDLPGPDMTTVYISPQVETILGLTQEEWLNDPTLWAKHIHPDDRERAVPVYTRFLEGEPLPEGGGEYRMVRPDGRVVWIHDRVNVIRNEAGALVLIQGVMFDITERKQAEERLREAESRYRMLVERLPALTYIDSVQDEPSVIYISPQIAELLGFSVEDWLADPSMWERQVHPDDREAAVAAKELLRVFGQQHRVEYRMFAKNGSIRWVRDEADLIRNEQGEPLLIQGVALDITVRKLAEEALRESEEKFRSIVETTSEWIWAIDHEGRHTYTNPAITEILGYEAEEILGASSVDLMHEEDAHVVVEALPTLIAEKRGWTGWVLRWRHKDGSYRYLESNAVPILDDDGTLLGYRGADRDITERKRAEQRLRESEERFKALANAAFEAVAIHEEGMILDANQAFCSMFGCELDEVIGKSALDFAALQSRDVILANIRSGAEGPYEALAERADGSQFPVEIRARAFAYQGRQVRMTAIRDITERAWVEQELVRVLRMEREAGNRLRRVDEMKNTFLQAVSHDLRRPLASILWLAETLRREDMGLSADQAREMAGNIAGSARSLDKMVNDLLDLDRLERGGLEPNRQQVDVGELVRRVVTATDLGTRPLEVEVESAVIQADITAVERIVENLLVNVARHTPDGTPAWVRLEADDDSLTIVVEDDGPGVPENQRRTIFEPFRQGSKSDSSYSHGVGVGLSLVARFAELHGGGAWVEERMGGGASFRVSLPREVPQPAESRLMAPVEPVQ
jgi:PAS domain S-box-containing protein